MVPTKATSSSGTNPVSPAKAKPVMAMSRLAARRARRRLMRCAETPRAMVKIADPRSVAVEIAPMAKAP
jgi:hypothetical protein